MALKMQRAATCKRSAPFARNSVAMVRCQASSSSSSWASRFPVSSVAAAAGLSCLAANLLAANMAMAEFRLPPIDNDPNRCDRGYVGNTIGQANAVSDKILDLRLCSYKGKDLHGRVLAGALLSDADLSETNLQEAVLTKAYAVKANFENADMTNAVVDRVDFSGANLRGVRFINTVVTGAQFAGADLEGSVWEDALIGSQDVGKLCENPTLTGDSRLQVGCRVTRK
ncbi:hypothetical protein Vretimale_15375 [Volvox reticuliferus]|uniref:Thylakoid lumenal 17.4 kDa protein, chloroplastic n=1 Tax=Volvox reticuliferus TaxID=1737510 RepID=A0A8J4CXG6_9CHLO|nr:hypothetical protein Vretifemale_16435 [Volvox reticuliferus]GIM11937.1 hypothetical protein Vretimale_15375 [Volvox reticuliferus]